MKNIKIHKQLLGAGKKLGFTLVELSIVLVIIGLLIGGILVGQSLIESVKLKNLQRDIVSIEAITSQFYLKYKGLPGDTNKLPNGGNNNALVENNEYRKSLYHLAIAVMLPESYRTISYAMTGSVYNEPNNPKTNMIRIGYDGVGLNFSYFTGSPGIVPSNCTSGSDYWRGNHLRIQKIDGTEGMTGHSYPNAFISRNDYLALDQKMDDGNGRNGKLWAYGNGGKYATNYACTVGYNTCMLGGGYSVGWRANGFWNDPAFERTVPSCGILYWYDYK